MSNTKNSYEADWQLAQACLEGDDAAMTEVQTRYHERLMGHLINRGASETEAVDLLGDLWAECAMGKPGRPPLFQKFHGKCALYTWMVTVATHRLVDVKRRLKFRGSLPAPADEPEAAGDFDRLPGEDTGEPVDQELTNLMRDALRSAINQCTAEQNLLLRLVFLHGVMQREAAEMFGWHESKVSRTLDKAMNEIAARTLEHVKRVDPWLELNWQDFLELCGTSKDLWEL